MFPRMPSGTGPELPRHGSGGPHRPRQASPRVLAIAGGVCAAAVIAIVLGVVLTRGGHKAPAGQFPKVGDAHWSGALRGASEANVLFRGIPQRGLVLGRSSAPVEMELVIDVQCPFCQSYVEDDLTPILRKYVRPGKVQIRLEPWAFINARSFAGRLAFIAASFQNKMFEYAKVLYDNQGPEGTGWLTNTMMEKIAASVNGLKLAEWKAATTGPHAASIGHGVDLLVSRDHIQGTPRVLVGRAGSKLRDVTSNNSPPDLRQTEQALDTALAGK